MSRKTPYNHHGSIFPDSVFGFECMFTQILTWTVLHNDITIQEYLNMTLILGPGVDLNVMKLSCGLVSSSTKLVLINVGAFSVVHICDCWAVVGLCLILRNSNYLKYFSVLCCGCCCGPHIIETAVPALFSKRTSRLWSPTLLEMTW